MAVRATLVLVSVIVTVAFGTTAPDESVTLPTSVALTACARTFGVVKAVNKQQSIVARTTVDLAMWSLQWDVLEMHALGSAFVGR